MVKQYHTFSIANYYNPEQMHFGVLRVLNDDEVQAGMGFGTHPHDNMEIISIPLEGDLIHKDSMGNVATISQGDVQVMSAGTGITHSEYNKNTNKPVKFLQIWIFPNKRNVAPRYGQITLNAADRHNRWQQIISPNVDDEGLWIHQNAWFYLTKADPGVKLKYSQNLKENGTYIFVLSGNATVNGHALNSRDGLGITNTNDIEVLAGQNCELLLMEVPMQL